MLYIIFFFVWLIFGSFISVLIYRIKNQESWIFLWRSKCLNCQHILWLKDLFPIFSYIFLKWKCQYCDNKISIIYPILELVTWLFFVFLIYLVLWTWNIWVLWSNLILVIYTLIVWILIIAIAFYDILFYEISFILAFVLWFLLFLPQILWIIWDFNLSIILWLSGFVAFLCIWFIRKYIRKKDWLGGWDAIWAWLIWVLTPIFIEIQQLQIYPARLVFYVLLFLWFLVALVWTFFSIMIWKKIQKDTMIPFLPFMFLWIIVFVFFWEILLKFIML